MQDGQPTRFTALQQFRPVIHELDVHPEERGACFEHIAIRDQHQLALPALLSSRQGDIGAYARRFADGYRQPRWLT
jgi:hypothetical protein